MEKEKKILRINQTNFIRGFEHELTLPRYATDGDIIDLILLDYAQHMIFSDQSPIRNREFVGSRVILGGYHDWCKKIDINPKFIWDDLKREWILNTFGYICFAEIEINN
jgi:hypothetical protein